MIKYVPNVGVNIEKTSCISVFRYINQLTKVLIRINIVFIFSKLIGPFTMHIQDGTFSAERPCP